MEKIRPTVSFIGFSCILILIVTFSGCGTTSNTKADLSPSESESDRWPNTVKTKIPLIGELHGNTVPIGTTGFLIRVEDDTILLDLGHNGIHRLRISDTNFREQFENPSERNFGLFADRYEKMFFMPTDSEGLRKGELQPFDYFVNVYFDFYPSKTKSSLANILRIYGPILKDDLNTQILLIPHRDPFKHNQKYLEQGFDFPTITGFLRKGFVHANQHGPEGRSGIVVVDRNGRILMRSFDEDTSFKDHFRSAKRLIAKDQKI